MYVLKHLKIQFIVLSISFFTCSVDAHDHEHADDAFHWTKEKTEFAQIKVEVAGPGKIQNSIQVCGKVIMHPDCQAFVVPKVCGSVCEVRKNLGDVVEKDEILAMIESKEIAEAKANYLAALKKLSVYQILLSKEMLLVGISPEQDLLNAELAVDEAELYLELAIQNLFAYGLNCQEIQEIQCEDLSHMRLYKIRSPLKGRVLERQLCLGEFINISNKIFTIGNFDKVWAEINVPQNDLHMIKEGAPIELVACGKNTNGVIAQFNPLICEETRMATALTLIENTEDRWSPGEFVTASIQIDSADADIVIPLAALQIIKGEHFVFVENDQGFIPSIVTLGKQDRHNVEIISGLTPGATYAASNTFCLKAEYEKEEAEHSH